MLKDEDIKKALGILNSAKQPTPKVIWLGLNSEESFNLGKSIGRSEALKEVRKLLKAQTKKPISKKYSDVMPVERINGIRKIFNEMLQDILNLIK